MRSVGALEEEALKATSEWKPESGGVDYRNTTVEQSCFSVGRNTHPALSSEQLLCTPTLVTYQHFDFKTEYREILYPCLHGVSWYYMFLSCVDVIEEDVIEK